MNSLVSAFHRYFLRSAIFWWSVLLGMGLRFHLSKFRSSCSRGWCSASSSCSSSSSTPCLSITLGGWWKEEEEKKPSPHMFQNCRVLQSTYFLLQQEKTGMPPDPSMTDNVNCKTVLCMLMDITLMVLSPNSANYKLFGDLVALVGRADLRWAGPSCLEQQLHTAKLEGQA